MHKASLPSTRCQLSQFSGIPAWVGPGGDGWDCVAVVVAVAVAVIDVVVIRVTLVPEVVKSGVRTQYLYLDHRLVQSEPTAGFYA